MIFEKLNNPNFPSDDYVDIMSSTNEIIPINADVSIRYPYNDDKIDYKNCICIFWVRGCLKYESKRYFLAKCFDHFTLESIKENEGDYKTEGVLIFYKDLDFLENFKKNNEHYIGT